MHKHDVHTTHEQRQQWFDYLLTRVVNAVEVEINREVEARVRVRLHVVDHELTQASDRLSAALLAATQAIQ